MPWLWDTEVLSSLRRRKPEKSRLWRWQGTIDPSEVFISSITLFELRRGIVLVERRDEAFAALLRQWNSNTVLPVYGQRILPVSQSIAECCAGFFAQRTVPLTDGLLAATARVHGLTLATRNVKDFEGLGVEVINPWADA